MKGRYYVQEEKSSGEIPRERRILEKEHYQDVNYY